MKHKKRLPGKLWPFRKEKDLPPYISYLPGSSSRSDATRLWDEYKLPIIIFVIALIVLISNVISFAQERKLLPLKINERVPDIRINNILNSPETSISISDYKEKLLILDFWFTHCGTCVEDMPTVSALQKQFGRKIKILQIDFEKPEEVLKFYKYHPLLKKLGLEVACSDTSLAKLFPHIYSPHVIWIDHGIFIAATADDYLTAKNIDSVLNKNHVALTTKVDRPHWDFQQPLRTIINSPGLESVTKIYGATLSGYIPAIGNGARLMTDSSTGDQRFDFLNYPILNFYGAILKSGLPLTANRRILHVPDRSKYLDDGQMYQDVWDAKNCYSFEATVPKGVNRDQILKQLKMLVETELGVTGSIQKVNTDVLVIRFKRNPPKISRYKKTEHELHPGLPMYFHYATGKDIADLMNTPETMLPVIDETYSKRHFDLADKSRPDDANSWRKALETAGLELVLCKRSIDMFILTETRTNAALQSSK